MTKSDTVTEKPHDILWAVWKYDQFPYHLCAQVEEIDHEGYVKAKGYRGCRFKPVTLLYGKNGEQVHLYLRAARSTHHDMNKGMRASLNNALHSKLKILGVPAGNVPPAYDFRWAILGEIFDRQVQGILDGNAPSFAWEGNVDSVTSPKVVHEEPEPESEPKFTGFRKYLEYLGFGS